jgi:hypothetical protein
MFEICLSRLEQSKAEILNEQFQSVFTKENLINCPTKGNSPYQTMSDIKINCKGVTKLLKNQFFGIFFVVSADIFHILFICLSYFKLNFLLESFISINISFLLGFSISMEKSRYLQDKGRSRIIWKHISKHRKERY